MIFVIVKCPPGYCGDRTMRVSKQQVVDNRTRILDAALALFSEKGFGGAPVAEVMRKAGMTHGGFYNHFDSKDELEVQACALAFSFGQRAVASIADVPAGPARRAQAPDKSVHERKQRYYPAAGPSLP